MCSLLRHARHAGDETALRIDLDHDRVRAHALASPGISGLATIVILDGGIVPTAAHYARWAETLAAAGFSHMRTGALAPRFAVEAARAALVCVQELTLLEVTAPLPRHGHHQSADLPLLAFDVADAARIDRLAFGDRWWLDAPILHEVCRATPRHRARMASGTTDSAAGGFLISGRADRTGYVQRLAVTPELHRTGIATALLEDSFAWFRRHRVQRVFVNTHVDNGPALALYHAWGFSALRDHLAVYEGSVAP